MPFQSSFGRMAAAAAFALSLAAPASAQTFRAENRVYVNPLPSGAFEVIEGGGYGARGLWCAAADYATDVLGASGITRLYVQQARGNSITQPGRKGVVFGLDPAGAVPSSALVLGNSIRTPGANLSVAHAQQFCADFRLNNRF